MTVTCTVSALSDAASSTTVRFSVAVFWFAPNVTVPVGTGL